LAWHTRTGEDCAADQLRGQFSARKFLKKAFGSAATTTTTPPGGGVAELRIEESKSHDPVYVTLFDSITAEKEKGRVSEKLIRGRMEIV
jgi:hypothetical protein